MSSSVALVAASSGRHFSVRAVFVHHLREHGNHSGCLTNPLDELGQVLRKCRPGCVLPFSARAFPSAVALSGPTSMKPAMKSWIQAWNLGSSFSGIPRILANHHHRHGIGIVVDGVDPGLALRLVEEIDYRASEDLTQNSE